MFDQVIDKNVKIDVCVCVRAVSMIGFVQTM